jgi:hypothetical protein
VLEPPNLAFAVTLTPELVPARLIIPEPPAAIVPAILIWLGELAETPPPKVNVPPELPKVKVPVCNAVKALAIAPEDPRSAKL